MSSLSYISINYNIVSQYLFNSISLSSHIFNTYLAIFQHTISLAYANFISPFLSLLFHSLLSHITNFSACCFSACYFPVYYLQLTSLACYLHITNFQLAIFRLTSPPRSQVLRVKALGRTVAGRTVAWQLGSHSCHVLSRLLLETRLPDGCWQQHVPGC